MMHAKPESWSLLHGQHEVLVITTSLPDESSGSGFRIVWYKMARDIAPRVELYYDSWAAFRDLAPLFAWLAEHDGQCLTCTDIMCGFASLGVQDVTRD
jgi:hypothetical protein